VRSQTEPVVLATQQVTVGSLKWLELAYTDLSKFKSKYRCLCCTKTNVLQLVNGKRNLLNVNS